MIRTLVSAGELYGMVWYGIVEFNVPLDIKLHYIPYHWDTGIRGLKRAMATLPQYPSVPFSECVYYVKLLKSFSC